MSLDFLLSGDENILILHTESGGVKKIPKIEQVKVNLKLNLGPFGCILGLFGFFEKLWKPKLFILLVPVCNRMVMRPQITASGLRHAEDSQKKRLPNKHKMHFLYQNDTFTQRLCTEKVQMMPKNWQFDSNKMHLVSHKQERKRE